MDCHDEVQRRRRSAGETFGDWSEGNTEVLIA